MKSFKQILKESDSQYLDKYVSALHIYRLKHNLEKSTFDNLDRDIGYIESSLALLLRHIASDIHANNRKIDTGKIRDYCSNIERSIKSIENSLKKDKWVKENM